MRIFYYEAMLSLVLFCKSVPILTFFSMSFAYAFLPSFIGLKKFPHGKGPGCEFTKCLLSFNAVFYAPCIYFGLKCQGSIHFTWICIPRGED